MFWHFWWDRWGKIAIAEFFPAKNLLKTSGLTKALAGSFAIPKLLPMKFLGTEAEALKSTGTPLSPSGFQVKNSTVPQI